MASSKKKLKVLLRYLKILSLSVLAGLTLTFCLYLLFLFFYQGKVYPGIYISGYGAGGKTPAQIYEEIYPGFEIRSQNPIKLNYQNQTYTINTKDALPELELDQAISSAYYVGRSGNYLQDFYEQSQAVLFQKELTPKVTFKKKANLTSQINEINKLIQVPPVDAQIILEPEIKVVPSQDGLTLDKETLTSQIESFLSLTSPTPTLIPVKTIPPNLSTQTASKYQEVLTRVDKSPIKLKFEDFSWTISKMELYSLIDFSKDKPQEEPAALSNQEVVVEGFRAGNTPDIKETILSEKKLIAYLEGVAGKVYRPVQEARFSFDPATKKAQEFQPGLTGRQLDINKTSDLFNKALAKPSQSEIELPVDLTYPKSNTSDVNSFGINELLGQGLSYFSGSITNRIYNLGLASSRLNGVLVPPGGVFSFNSTIGDVSAATGYKQAYVIKSGRTVLDDGGGVCQVSTTLFRAVLNSGLPIVERTAHAYRVGYYEQKFPPGLDATVYAPGTDFKFKNDTPNYILIQAKVGGTALTVDIYGTPDGRSTMLTKPIILSQTPPLPEIRQDDPTLPKGEVKQVDWPASGAKVTFDRTVVRNEEVIIQETWSSNYRPWQAVYLVGTKE